MNISHRREYLYFVVPKCASRTIRSALGPHTDVGYPVDDFQQHMTVSQFKATQYAEHFDHYFKFTFVRNPYDRLYSGYMQDRFAAANYAEWTEVKKPIFDVIGDDFNRYVREYVAAQSGEHAWDYVCFWPMAAFATDDGKFCIDWFGRAETVDADLAVLSQKLGMPIHKEKDMNVRVKATGQLKYLAQFERSTVELVNELYANDFDLFGYQMLDPGQFPVSLP